MASVLTIKPRRTLLLSSCSYVCELNNELKRTKFFNSLIHDKKLDGLLFLQSNREVPYYCPLVLLSLFLTQILLNTQMFCLLKSAKSA